MNFQSNSVSIMRFSIETGFANTFTSLFITFAYCLIFFWYVLHSSIFYLSQLHANYSFFFTYGTLTPSRSHAGEF